jgi:hypothetical protein
MGRYISVRKTNYNIDAGGTVYYVEVWPVPDDFSENEEILLAEICANGSLSVGEGHECVRLLRK